MTWNKGPMWGFDTETTGVDPMTDRIVTAALVRRHGAHHDVTTWLIDPGVAIPAEASAIHGITTEHARAHGRPPAEALEEIARMLATGLRAGAAVVAYNAAFDLSLLDAELARHGLAGLAARLGRPVRPVVDPLVLDRALDRYRRGKRRLGDLCRHYRIDEAGLHSADVDVLATLAVLDALVAGFPALREHDLDAVHDFQISAHRRWAERFNAWRAEQGHTGTGANVEWPTMSVGTSVGTAVGTSVGTSVGTDISSTA